MRLVVKQLLTVVRVKKSCYFRVVIYEVSHLEYLRRQ
jgi:hypothetical protein